MAGGPHVAVIGAGAFGGWTALELARRGRRVTLVDAWGPGHVRSSSGGETRIIRATYGSRDVYTRMAIRALERWREHERRFAAGLLRECGVLWMFADDDGLAEASARTLRERDVPFHELDVADAGRRYPQIRFDGVRRVWFEPDAGYLLASRACTDVARHAAAAGAELRVAGAASPARIEPGRMGLLDGGWLHADLFVFACGPWLATLFPDLIGPHLAATRQEVHYFGTPAGDSRFVDPHLPVWLDCGDRIHYGIPGHPGRGFKVADDTPGPPIDPTTDERQPSTAGVAAAREFLGRRFPAMARAPLVASEVCQYEATPDSHFIVDRHPDHRGVWIAGGGSGHGFKMGPAIGELLADIVCDDAAPDPVFGLARFASPPETGWTPKWA